MSTNKNTLRTCAKGHQFHKTSDCPTCPICEAAKKPKDGLLSLVGAPARRALQANGITTLEKLSEYAEKELLALHGFGPSSIPKLKNALEEKGLTFKND